MPLNKFDVTIGGESLTKSGELFLHECYIYEDITQTAGPVCEIRMVDASGKSKTFNGSRDQPIKISFADQRGNAEFEFYQASGNDKNDLTKSNQGSSKSIDYTVRGVTKEFRDAQGNYAQFTSDKPVNKTVERILKDCYKTELPVNTDDELENNKLVFSNEHPFDAIKKANHSAVSKKYKSSLLACFYKQENGKRSYEYKAFESLYEKESVTDLKLSTVTDSSAFSGDKEDTLISYNVPQNFYAPSRHYTNSKANYVNAFTHKVTVEENNTEPQFKTGGQPIYKGKAKNQKEVPIHTVYNKGNQPKSPVTNGSAAVPKSQFASQMTQTECEVEFYGNTKVTLGSCVNLKLPNSSDGSTGGTETQVAEKCLVTRIKHCFRPKGEQGQELMYTQVATLVKGGWQQGGGTA